MAATNAIYAQDGTAYLRGSYPDDEAWFEAAMGHGGADGCVLNVTPDTGGAYFAAGGGAHFIDVPGDNITVRCAQGANFAIDASVGGPTSLIRCVGKQNFKWYGGQFLKSGANVTAGQSFFSSAPSGSTNSDGFEIRDVEFTLASTNTALDNFQCINILGVSSSEWGLRARRCLVDNCTLFTRNVQQATALGTLLAGPVAYSSTRYGGVLLRSRHTSALKVSNIGCYGSNTTTGGNWDASHWLGGLLWIENDEGGFYTNIDANGVDLMASDGTGSSLIQIGDTLGAGEGGHFILSGATIHSISARYGIDCPKTQFNVISNFEIGRCGFDAAIHAGPPGHSSTIGEGLVLANGDFHNINRATYSVNGALGTSATLTTKTTGGYSIHLEYSSNVNVQAIDFGLISQDRIALRADPTCSQGSICFDAQNQSWWFKPTTTPFIPVEAPDPGIFQQRNTHQGRGPRHIPSWIRT